MQPAPLQRTELTWKTLLRAFYVATRIGQTRRYGNAISSDFFDKQLTRIRVMLNTGDTGKKESGAKRPVPKRGRKPGPTKKQPVRPGNRLLQKRKNPGPSGKPAVRPRRPPCMPWIRCRTAPTRKTCHTCEQVLGANPLIGFDGREVLGAIGGLFRILSVRADFVIREQYCYP